MTNSSYFKPATIALHTGYSPESDHGSRAVPIYQTTSYAFESVQGASSLFNVEQGGHIYSRISNPTVAVLEQRLAALEGGTGAICTASGMSALFATFITLCSAGDHIVSSEQIYGSTATTLRYTLKRFGIETDFIDINDEAALKAAIKPNTKLVFCESISNPGMQVSNLPVISKIANDAGVPVVIDATFATPALNRPIEHGANIVVHSITKWIGGHGAAIGGCIIDGGNFDWGKDDRYPALTQPCDAYHGVNFFKEFGNMAMYVYGKGVGQRDIGCSQQPMNAFLTICGLETLPLRMQRHVENAQKVAEWLSKHDSVAEVSFAGLPASPYHELAKKYTPKGPGSLFTFDIKGGMEESAEFLEGLKLFTMVANLGDARSLIIHPASTTHGQLSAEHRKIAGIGDGTMRVSIGLEHSDDIIDDLQRGFDAIGSSSLRKAG